MTETILVNSTSATSTFKNPIAKKFFDSLESVASEIKSSGKLKYESIASIIGDAPTIPDSPDMDARLEAFDELASYADMVLNVEAKLKTYAK